MLLSDINIRDPFVLCDGGKYYLYGTRARFFGRKVGGFDVYVSDDLVNWSKPIKCFDSRKNRFNREVNWAPEVHTYNGKYYMFATFTGKNRLRGTFSLVSESPTGPFVPTSRKPLTPEGWECLDGTFYISREGEPYLVFCHEHTQIIDGSVCYMKLNETLTEGVGEAVTLFHGSTPYYIPEKPKGKHYITDGPFMHRSENGDLFMIWSTFIDDNYAQCIAKSENGEIDGNFTHLEPLIKDDGGHGMLFKSNGKLFLTFHSPNKTGSERPKIVEIRESGDSLCVVCGE